MSNQYSNLHYDYATLNNYQGGPLFKVTPAKNCRLFPYLYSKECAMLYANPCYKNPFICRSEGPVDPNQKYLNMPVRFEYNLAGEKACDAPDCKACYRQ
jgi:hypothetical protein